MDLFHKTFNRHSNYTSTVAAYKILNHFLLLKSNLNLSCFHHKKNAIHFLSLILSNQRYESHTTFSIILVCCDFTNRWLHGCLVTSSQLLGLLNLTCPSFSLIFRGRKSFIIKMSILISVMIIVSSPKLTEQDYQMWSGKTTKKLWNHLRVTKFIKQNYST